jgi:hypothetical protein
MSQPSGALLVCPATHSVLRLAHRRGWAQTIIAAGGSVLDLALCRRLGVTGMLALAASEESSGSKVIYCTRPLAEFAPQGIHILFSGVHTALVNAGFLA